MPTVEIDAATTIHYEDDCFAEPWSEPETVILVHGVAETSAAWYGWMPTLTARYRVIRPDLRGFGRSTVPAPGYEWSLEGHARDLRELVERLGIARAHVIGAKYGGAVAVLFAAEHPDVVSTLTLTAPVIKGGNTGSRVEISSLAGQIDRDGAHGVVTGSQRLRLGSSASQGQIDWWDAMMNAASEPVIAALLRVAAAADISAVLPKIAAPTLVITTDKSPIYDLAWVVEWQRSLVASDLLVYSGDGHHVAAIYPEQCARDVDAFIMRHLS